MMKLDVPFYKQTTPLNCGPVALKMVLDYFDEEIDVKVLEERVGIKESKGVSTVQIAIASKLFGYKTKLLSKNLSMDKSNFDLEFYKRYYDDLSDIEKLVGRAKDIGVEIEERSIELDELLGYVSRDSVLIVLLDWNVAMERKEKGYQGHFVVVTGYEDENVIVHNHGMKDTKKDMEIKKELFDEARKAKGTDEDVIIIMGKKN
jgi:hypothetical protein